MDEVLRRHLEDIKKVMGNFGLWITKAGTTIHKSDIIMTVDVIEQWRVEAEVLLMQDEDGAKINEMLVAWISQARQHLKKEPLSDFHAVWDLVYIDEPKLSAIIVKINTFIYRRTGDIRTFLL